MTGAPATQGAVSASRDDVPRLSACDQPGIEAGVPEGRHPPGRDGCRFRRRADAHQHRKRAIRLRHALSGTHRGGARARILRRPRLRRADDRLLDGRVRLDRIGCRGARRRTTGLARHYVYLLKEEPPTSIAHEIEATSSEAGEMIVRGRAAHALLGEGYQDGVVDPSVPPSSWVSRRIGTPR